MAQNGSYLTHIFPYRDRIVNSVTIRENIGQRKPVLWHILGSAWKNSHKINNQK